MNAALTEPEFRRFGERLEGFVRTLTPKERSFLTAILVRATLSGSLDLPSAGSHPDAALCADLAYALWMASLAPEQAITRNPQPMAPVLAAPSQSQDSAIADRDGGGVREAAQWFQVDDQLP